MSETLTRDIETAPSVRGEVGPETVEAIVRDRGEPDWMAERRRRAWEVYQEMPMPTTKTEEWRYTDLSKIPWQDLKMHLPERFDRIMDPARLPEEPSMWARGSARR